MLHLHSSTDVTLFDLTLPVVILLPNLTLTLTPRHTESGIPLLYFVLTFFKRDILRKPEDERTEDEKESVAHIHFLVGNYKPEFW